LHWIISTGDSCKLKFRRKIKPLGTLSAALRHYDLPFPGFHHQGVQTEQPLQHDAGMMADLDHREFSLPLLEKQFENLPIKKQVATLETLFAITCTKLGILCLPTSYISNSLSGMHHDHLKMKGKSNVLTGAAYVFGSMRPNQSDSRFTTDRMPFALIEHCINFYSANSIREVDLVHHCYNDTKMIVLCPHPVICRCLPVHLSTCNGHKPCAMYLAQSGSNCTLAQDGVWWRSVRKEHWQTVAIAGKVYS